MTNTSREAVKRLIAPIREHLEAMEQEIARLSYIKATIRVNAMKHGATEEQIEAFQSGGLSFVNWMIETITGPQSALLTRAETAEARLAEAVEGLEKIAKFTTGMVGSFRAVNNQACATLANIKGETDKCA